MESQRRRTQTRRRSSVELVGSQDRIMLRVYHDWRLDDGLQHAGDIVARICPGPLGGFSQVNSDCCR